VQKIKIAVIRKVSYSEKVSLPHWT